jgi:hypothetical protein
MEEKDEPAIDFEDIRHNQESVMSKLNSQPRIINEMESECSEPATEKKQISSISHTKTNSVAFIPVMREFEAESECDNMTDKSMPLNIHVEGKLHFRQPMEYEPQGVTRTTD